MPAHPGSGYMAFGLMLASSLVTAAEGTAGADQSTPLTPEQCALLENGVQRLACYDNVFHPDSAQKNSDTEEIEKVQDQAVDTGDGEGVMDSVVNQYLEAEKALFSFSGSFVGHRPTYLLPASWVKNPNRTPSSPRLGETGYDYRLEREEAKYQISFKVPLLTGLLDDRTTLWFGYTQRSFWQVYNQDDSAPFRATDYEPEIFLRYESNYSIGPGTLNGISIGLNHQSNGQSEPRSRSWNRIMGTAIYSYDRWLFLVQPWYRIPENSNDDNADIEKYLGHANYIAVYKLSEERTLSLQVQNNLRSDNHTSVEFGYSFPMGKTVKGFFQYFNGYGESLIDYNHRIQRFGIGIMLNDWL